MTHTAKVETTKKSTLRGFVMIVAMAIIAPIVILGLVEGVLRTTNVGYNTDLLEPCAVQGNPAHCYNLFFAAPYFPNGMIQTPRPYSIPAVRQPRTFRIVVLGESAAMGDPDPAYGFSRYLEVLLRQKYPSVNFEVINTGSVAINSHVTLRIAEEMAKHQPDLFIIYSGNNEVVGPYGPGTALASSSGMQMPVIRASMSLRRSRIGQLATKFGTPKQEWRGMELFLDKHVPAGSPLLKFAYRNFERNLRETIEVAQRSGAHVIVSTVGTNLKDCAPFGSVHRSGLSSEQLQSWTKLVNEGEALENAGSISEALRSYSEAAKIDPEYAELQFRMARCFSAAGDFKAAHDLYARARDLDSLRFRADTALNEINRSVALSIKGVDLVDVVSTLEQHVERGVLGAELMFDHVHFTPEGNYLIATAMFQKISRLLPSEFATSRSIPTQEECDRELSLTKFDKTRLASEMLQRISKRPFTTQLNHREQVARYTQIAQQVEESPYETIAAYQWAIAHHPEDRMLHYRAGMFLFRYNPQGAAEQLRLSQPWDGFPVFLPDGRQIQ